MSTSDPKRPDDDADTDTGRHAVARPTPAPPEPAADAPDPVVAPGTSRPAAADPSATPAPAAAPPSAPPSGPAPARTSVGDRTAPTQAAAGSSPAGDDPGTGTAPPTGAPVPSPPPAERDDDELFPDPNAPRTPHAGTHVLGVLVGLVLAPLALALTLVGQSRILVVQADRWDASLELLGIALVTAGVLLLAALLVLGLWTAAVPLTAGVVLGVLGGVYLYAPGVARTASLDVVGADTWRLTVTQVTVAGTSGTAIVAGALLLTAGVVVALARRHGVRLGVFRERNRAH
ncbi:MAG: hypothetical protein J7503_09110 [Cellulomonas iranensis]|uniref:hypothetical protein n=1 Tax=Cellulomonas iranensis TaxID=76862 RepID=UPI001B263DE9|nr:hypothetical protein [Cellulomonas iranensis]MBO9568972.1 hypothetical protein [Cellulomonas iranensis]